MLFSKEIINTYILLISITLIISSNETNTSLEYCDINKYCSDCSFCGNQTNDYTSCSFYNIFCTDKFTNHVFFQESNIKKYSTFFKKIPNATDFCGQEKYTLDSFTNSFSIINKTKSDIKHLKISHCNYEINNTKYFHNYESLANLIIKFKTKNFKKNNLKLIFNILLQDSSSKSSKQITINEVDLIKKNYELILYNYDKIILLLDFFMDGEIKTNIDEYFEIKIDIDNPDIYKQKLVTNIFFATFCLFFFSIILIMIYIHYRCEKTKNMNRTQNDFLQQEKTKRKKKEDRKINKLFENILISKEFNKSDITNDCTQCAICIEKFVDKCLIFITPCKHIFHYECLSKYIEVAKGKQKTVIKCPLCNYDFLEEKNDEIKSNEISNFNYEINNNIINKNENNMQQNNSTIQRRVVDRNFIILDITSKENFKNNNMQTD